MNRPSFFLVALFSMVLGCGPKISTAHVTVRVVGDDNLPVPEAKVIVMAFNTQEKGRSGKDGTFVATLRSATGQLDLLVEKDGFYPIRWHSYFLNNHTNGQWLPWNPTIELQLHKTGKSVPMVVKQVDQTDIPAVNRITGYDLLIGDWVEPYGTGKVADFIIEVIEPLTVASNDFIRLHLTFSNPEDGLIVLRLFYRNDYGLRLAALAPESGYSNRWEWQACDGSPSAHAGWNVLKNGDQDANFYFRVRTKTNDQGQVVSAMYGKIYEGIQFGSATYPERMPLHFLYYLNPDGTRNTEFDTRSNLCPNPGTAGGRP